MKKYVKMEPIYESMSSIVYRALQKSTTKPVILKILKKKGISQQQTALIHREFTILSGLNLSGVIKAEGLEEFDEAHDLQNHYETDG